ncbi:ImmA/IrrE family metallo-endopeptidase [Cytobacillus firmus]|uniref:ImmA/IrrE family metallo-endopeptidase n=1 Tax=Cytobacillus firmus TaxID=1399 RepID=UPI0018CD24CB|nr:ImmA/IrrE family metallo-endopeptidase [Cytobacillus firmus]MBG9603925.1 peptidase [Cytobacillus firmus]MBG9656096.1 peptidase [Cytobacillus firmus]MED1907823.1 peptidase [Cytobacillus firmus]
MQTLYPTTALEDWVTEFYLRMKIYRPNQIDEEIIAKRHAIFLHKKPYPSFYQIVGRYRGITVDNRVLKTIQREQFFHELCHLLRHAGKQSKMPHSFRILQEWDSYHFTKYAAIPHHMLKFVDFEDPYVVDIMSGMFKITPDLCIERLEDIKRRRLLLGKEMTSCAQS